MRWMKIGPACEHMGGISTKTLYAAVRSGKCKAAHIGAGRNLLFSLAQRLSALDEEPDAPSEICALGLIAASVCEKLELMLDQARALFNETHDHIFTLENGRRPGKGERREDQAGGAG